MTIETDLNVMEHAGRTWRFTLQNESGEVLPLDGYVIYGAAECPGQALRAFTVEVKGGVATVRMPGLPVGDWPWKYQLFVQEVSSRVEWLLCCGSVNVLGRVAGGHVALSPEQLEFTGVLDRVTQQASIVVGENMVSIAENARRATQAALDSQIARGDAEAAREGAQVAQAGAEAAREGAQVAQAGAEAAREVALAARSGAEDAREGALAARSGAEAAREGALAAQGGAEDARDGALAAQGGAEAARGGALAAQGEAEAARDGALAAQGGAEDARDGALAARSGAEAARDGALAALAGAEGAQAVAEDAAGVAQGFAQRAAGAADEAVLAAAEAKAAEAGSAAAADVVRYDFLPMTLEWLDGRFTKNLGEGKFTMTYTEEENLLRVAFALETTEAQIEESRALLARVLPRNLVTEMEWADGLPMTYTHVEYLENAIGGDADAASILTDIYPNQNTRARIVAEAVSIDRTDMYYAFGCSGGVNQQQPFGCNWFNRYHKNEACFDINKAGQGVSTPFYTMSDGVAHTLEFSKENFKIDGVVKYTFGDIGEFTSTRKLMFLAETPNSIRKRCFRGKAYSFKLWENDTPILNFIPALDPTGAPCFFDIVTKKPYYSVTPWDFTYPGKETEATTYSLRAPRPYRPEYAKDTGRGIARLYRVPDGYDGSIEEYAAAYGYKWLVENEQPAEGDWQPVWRETEEQLILDWVETEAPTEEEL